MKTAQPKGLVALTLLLPLLEAVVLYMRAFGSSLCPTTTCMGSGEVEGTSFPTCTMGLGWQWALHCINPHCWGLDPHPGGPGDTWRGWGHGCVPQSPPGCGSKLVWGHGTTWRDDFFSFCLVCDPKCTL